MAQRTGADGLLASRAMKVTSTRVLLVLVVLAALAFSGCGGGSDGDSSTAASAGSRTEANSAQKAASEEPNPAGEGQGAKAKQGPGITPPKGPPEKGFTPAEEENATEADISLASPAFGGAGEGVQSIPATYTCDGKDTWPELQWSGVPSGTEELILFVVGMQPIEGALFFNWAVAGIDPATEGIEEGELPQGAILGKNGFGKLGYSICPQGEAETYVFSLYALPSSLSPAKGFDPLALKNQVMGISKNVGILIASYVRG
jgi:phosphatidylethanolamine-binding protein (PEBP) family uncharacterized protein